MKESFVARACVVFCSACISLQASTILYSTGFEPGEGYDIELELAGQRNWIVDGTGGNGIMTNVFEGLGQHAYVGFHPPTDLSQSTTVWTPVNITPLPTGPQILKFSTSLQLIPSTTGGDDEFRWAAYNQDGDRLFSVDFFMDQQRIYYDLEDLQAYDTGYTFDFEGVYDLAVYMDFRRNQWTAYLNDVAIVNSQPIRLTNSTPLNLGDVDAVWFINNAQAPGDNYMVFDDYTISSEELTSIPSVLEPLGINQAGNMTFRVQAERGVRYSVDVTTDFEEWFSLAEFDNTDGTFIFEDTTSSDFRYGFYRLREVLP